MSNLLNFSLSNKALAVVLFLIIFISFSFRSKKHRKNKPLFVYENLFDSVKQKIIAETQYNYNLKTGYLYNPPSTIPPTIGNKNYKKRIKDSILNLSIRYKEINSCDYATENAYMPRNEKLCFMCDSLETRNRIINMVENIVENKLKDSLHYYPTYTGSADITPFDEKLQAYINTRIETERKRFSLLKK